MGVLSWCVPVCVGALAPGPLLSAVLCSWLQGPVLCLKGPPPAAPPRAVVGPWTCIRWSYWCGNRGVEVGVRRRAGPPARGALGGRGLGASRVRLLWGVGRGVPDWLSGVLVWLLLGLGRAVTAGRQSRGPGRRRAGRGPPWALGGAGVGGQSRSRGGRVGATWAAAVRGGGRAGDRWPRCPPLDASARGASFFEGVGVVVSVIRWLSENVLDRSGSCGIKRVLSVILDVNWSGVRHVGQEGSEGM